MKALSSFVSGHSVCELTSNMLLRAGRCPAWNRRNLKLVLVVIGAAFKVTLRSCRNMYFGTKRASLEYQPLDRRSKKPAVAKKKCHARIIEKSPQPPGAASAVGDGVAPAPGPSPAVGDATRPVLFYQCSFDTTTQWVREPRPAGHTKHADDKSIAVHVLMQTARQASILFAATLLHRGP